MVHNNGQKKKWIFAFAELLQVRLDNSNEKMVMFVLTFMQ